MTDRLRELAAAPEREDFEAFADEVSRYCTPLCGPEDTPIAQAADYALQALDAARIERARVNDLIAAMRELVPAWGDQQSVRIAEIRQENRGGDVSSRDIEWLCDEVDRWRTGYAPELRELKAALDVEDAYRSVSE